MLWTALQPTGSVSFRSELRRAMGQDWARELTALGHDVRLMPAQYVKPYVKRGKNDAVDAEAICEAVTRPTMRFVAIKTADQRSAMMLHRVRLVLCRQRAQLSNALRAHMAVGRRVHRAALSTLHIWSGLYFVSITSKPCHFVQAATL